MTQEQKELLLKDLCARLPYGVKCSFGVDDAIYEVCGVNPTCCGASEIQATHVKSSINGDFSLSSCKPYLFPLSSMTEEQKEEISKRYNYHNPYELCVEITNHSEGYWDNDTSCNLQDYLWLEDWFNKNHFDYRGLIPMGLVNDATGLNIY